MEETTLQEILESTVAVARGLEALQNEHEALIKDYYASENIDSSEGTVVPPSPIDPAILLKLLSIYSVPVVSGR